MEEAKAVGGIWKASIWHKKQRVSRQPQDKIQVWEITIAWSLKSPSKIFPSDFLLSADMQGRHGRPLVIEMREQY